MNINTVVKIDIKIDTRKLTAITKLELAKQARFASAKTLTGAAFDTRAKLQRYIPIWLKVTRPFLQRSIGVNKATPSRLQAEVGFLPRADFVELLEKGGKRRPRGQAISVPFGDQLKKRRTQNTIRNLLAKPNTFSGVVKGVAGVWQRDKRTNRIRLLYAYELSTQYESKQIRFHDTVRVHVPKFIRRNLMRNLEEAIRTRKR